MWTRRTLPVIVLPMCTAPRPISPYSLRNVEYIINYTVKVLFTNLFIGETENLPQNSEMTTNKQHGERKARAERRRFQIVYDHHHWQKKQLYCQYKKSSARAVSIGVQSASRHAWMGIEGMDSLIERVCRAIL